MSLSRFVTDHLTTLALGGVVAASVYIMIGPSLTGRRRPGAVPGLVNTGNTCFINSVLQALASCSTFYHWLEEVVARDRREVRHAAVTRTLLETMRVLNNLSSNLVSDPYNPGLLLSGLRSHGWRINVEEQDAHELLHVLMTTLEEEIPAKTVNNKPSHASLLDIANLADDDDSDSDEEERFFSQRRYSSLKRGVSLPPESQSVTTRHDRDTMSMSRDTSPSTLTQRRRSGVYSRHGEQLPSSLVSSFTKPRNQSPFTGLLTSKLNYQNGGKSPVNYSKFDNITLTLPQHGACQSVSLQTLLAMFVSQETVQDSDARQSLVKQISFGKMPDCLCFHIQRTGFAGGQAYKRHDYVDYPQLLDMRRFTHSSQSARDRNLQHFIMSSAPSQPDSLDIDYKTSSSEYRLQAVIVHSGGIDSGHYVTFRRGPLGGGKLSRKWFYTSDSSVRQVSYDEVTRAPAYMIFYEKISADTTL